MILQFWEVCWVFYVVWVLIKIFLFKKKLRPFVQDLPGKMFTTPGIRQISGSVPQVSHNTAFSRGAKQRCAVGAG